jgi:hypothetical protein
MEPLPVSIPEDHSLREVDALWLNPTDPLTLGGSGLSLLFDSAYCWLATCPSGITG